MDDDAAGGAGQPCGRHLHPALFLVSATAGQLADKYDKAMLARMVKVLEMGIMGVAATGFALHSLPC